MAGKDPGLAVGVSRQGVGKRDLVLRMRRMVLGPGSSAARGPAGRRQGLPTPGGGGSEGAGFCQRLFCRQGRVQPAVRSEWPVAGRWWWATSVARALDSRRGCTGALATAATATGRSDDGADGGDGGNGFSSPRSFPSPGPCPDPRPGEGQGSLGTRFTLPYAARSSLATRFQRPL